MGNPYLVAVTANTVTDAINEMFNAKKTGLTGLFGVASNLYGTLHQIFMGHYLNQRIAHDIILSRIK